jgi:hypothetical protein
LIVSWYKSIISSLRRRNYLIRRFWLPEMCSVSWTIEHVSSSPTHPLIASKRRKLVLYIGIIPFFKHLCIFYNSHILSLPLLFQMYENTHVHTVSVIKIPVNLPSPHKLRSKPLSHISIKLNNILLRCAFFRNLQLLFFFNLPSSLSIVVLIQLCWYE